MKYLPNALALQWIVLCIPLLFPRPLSARFFMLYIICRISDMLDGHLARRLGCVGLADVRLNSAADFTLTAVLLLRLVPAMNLPVWLFWWIADIALIKFSSLAAGYVQHKQATFLHTYADKAAGLLLLCLLYGLPL